MRLTACLGLSCVIHVLSCSAYGEHQLPHSLPNRGALLFAQPPLFRSPASQQGLCSRPQQGLCARPILAPLRVPLPLGRVLGAGGGVLRQTSVEDSGVGAVEGAQGGPVEGAPDGGVAKVEKTCLHGVVTAFTGNFDGGRDVVIETLKSATGGKVSGTVHKRVAFLVCDDFALNKRTKHVRKAEKYAVPIVTFSYVEECLAQGRQVDKAPFVLVPPPAPVESADQSFDESDYDRL